MDFARARVGSPPAVRARFGLAAIDFRARKPEAGQRIAAGQMAAGRLAHLAAAAAMNQSGGPTTQSGNFEEPESTLAIDHARKRCAICATLASCRRARGHSRARQSIKTRPRGRRRPNLATLRLQLASSKLEIRTRELEAEMQIRIESMLVTHLRRPVAPARPGARWRHQASAAGPRGPAGSASGAGRPASVARAASGLAFSYPGLLLFRVGRGGPARNLEKLSG